MSGNAVEQALNRASDEQRQKAQAVIEEARRNIRLVSVQQVDDISPTAADAVAKNAQIIEEAKRSIPYETMQSVDEIGSPLQTPPVHGRANAQVVELNPNVQSTIENIEQGQGNNYLRENAVDRAMTRQPEQTQQWGQEQQQGMSR